MLRSIIRTVLVNALLLITVDVSAQTFEKIGTSSTVLFNPADARSAGLGGAVVAVADGALAVIVNPAGLALQEGVSVLPVAYHDIHLPEPFSLNPWQYTAAVSATVNHFGFGFAYSRYDLGRFPIRTLFRGEPIGEVHLSETALHMGAAYDLGGLLVSSGRLLASFGTTVKWIDLISSAQGWEWDVATLLGYRFTPRGWSVLPRLGVNVRDVIDGEFNLNDQPRVIQNRAALIGASVEIQPSWEYVTGPVLSVLATIQTDAFYGERVRKSIVRSGMELTTLDLVTGRIGIRQDNESNETSTDFGFGLRYGQLHVGSIPLGLQFDFASVDVIQRTEIYSLSLSLGL